MEDFREKTEEELFAIKHRKPVPNSTTREVDIEIQRRFQERNLQQIGVLVEEVEKLRKITDTNAKTSETNSRSSNRIALAAFFIGILSLLISALQMKFDYNHACAYTGDVVLKNQKVSCQTYLTIGAYDFHWEDKGYYTVKY